jgi:hypothetical protein
MPGSVQNLLAALGARYGRTGALAVSLAVVALTVVPVPGLVFFPIGIAEVLARLKGRRIATAAVPVRAKA